MKKLIGSALLVFTAITHAQTPNMTEQDLANMMGMLEDMASCFGQLDEQRLEEFGKRAEARGEEIEKLCAAGKRKEAQTKAVNHAKAFMADPEYKKIMQCGDVAQAMLPDLAAMHDLASEDESRHVCDAF